jgi:glucosamine-6-phosphate deaminase
MDNAFLSKEGLIKKFEAGKLKVAVYENRYYLGKAAAEKFHDIYRMLKNEKENLNIIFASAPSQNEFLENISKSTNIDWQKIKGFHMDEYIGIEAENPQSFRYYINKMLFSKVPLAEKYLIKGECENIKEECERYSELLELYPPDITCGGIGENGHIAFNDPSVANFNDPLKVKIVQLEDSCRKQQVNDGCFPDIDSVPQKAVTVTMPVFMKCRYILLMVPGNTKADAVKNTLFNAVSENCPASVLRNHQNAFLFLDKNSAKYINK